MIFHLEQSILHKYKIDSFPNALSSCSQLPRLLLLFTYFSNFYGLFFCTKQKPDKPSRAPWSCGLMLHELDREVDGLNLAIAMVHVHHCFCHRCPKKISARSVLPVLRKLGSKFVTEGRTDGQTDRQIL